MRFVGELGEGAFGVVCLGICENLTGEGDTTMVAVKVIIVPGNLALILSLEGRVRFVILI